jgi:hypothetical protein
MIMILLNNPSYLSLDTQNTHMTVGHNVTLAWHLLKRMPVKGVTLYQKI